MTLYRQPSIDARTHAEEHYEKPRITKKTTTYCQIDNRLREFGIVRYFLSLLLIFAFSNVSSAHAHKHSHSPHPTSVTYINM